MKLHSFMKHPEVYSWREVSAKQKTARIDDFTCLQDCDFKSDDSFFDTKATHKN